MKAKEVRHSFADPAGLTPYEQKLYELWSQGLNNRQISEALNGTSSPQAVRERMRIVREKIALKEITDAQDRRISWG